MHRFIAGTCRIEVALTPKSAWMIKGDTEEDNRTKKKKTFPVRDADRFPVLPGTSLKGVMRSTAERLLRELQTGRASDLTPLVDATFGESDKDALDGRARAEIADMDLNEWRKRLPNPMPPLNEREVYPHLSPVSQLFGTTLHASTMTVDDARASSKSTVERTHVPIDRDTATAHTTGPFTEVLAPAGDDLRSVTITVDNFALWQLALIGIVLDEINQGAVSIGHGTRKGQGRMAVKLRNISFSYPDIVYQPRVAGVISPQGWLATQQAHPLVPRDTPAEVVFEAGLTLLQDVPAVQSPADWRYAGQVTLKLDGNEQSSQLFQEAIAQVWNPWLSQYGVEGA